MRTDLNSGWNLRGPLDAQSPPDTPFPVPGDVHSALLAAQRIPNPYYRDNELIVDWVHRARWQIQRHLDLEPLEDGERAVLLLDGVDCVATVTLDGKEIGRMDNRFMRYAFDITDQIDGSPSLLSITFESAVEEAHKRAADYPLDLPVLGDNSRIAHVNHLRKTPCDAGWDWNIALMPLGIYGGVALERFNSFCWIDQCIRQHHAGGSVTVSVNLGFDVREPSKVSISAEIAGARCVKTQSLWPGQQQATIELLIQSPALWWPAGAGEQALHELILEVDNQVRSLPLALRDVELVQQFDATGDGAGFTVAINGRELFMRGANWIPADALPARRTVGCIAGLLDSAVSANMNMLRVWGGGQYEADEFYEACDRRGLLVWQDFMFSCNHYPATDPAWIASVRTEAHQQLRRLSRFGCIALWCGDNELIGALDWWPETRDNRDQYLANYVRLNTALEETVATERPDAVFWPSSPSHGPLRYGDAWKDDSRGDMHFWDVWHEAQPFEAYHTVRPRFCSEFGFQSFPSIPLINAFTEPADRNVSSAIMSIHQRNVGGNARIVETLLRHFPFPDSFERTVYLSQVQQSMAIRTAVEWWRSLKPHCMGTLYWQLNDTWPVASWASLEYGGSWKLLHYAARRFYAPLTVVCVPGDSSASRVLRAINDGSRATHISIRLRTVSLTGVTTSEQLLDAEVPVNKAITVHTFEEGTLGKDQFLHWSWAETTGGLSGYNTYVESPFKSMDILPPTISRQQGQDSKGSWLELNTDRVAFHVAVGLGGPHIWSDNDLTLLPGEPVRLYRERELSADLRANGAGVTIESI